MATIKVTKKTTVAVLKKQFSDQVGATMRVFNGGKTADDNDKLVDLGAKIGELEFRTSRTVGKFVESMKEVLNVKVKVRTADDWVTVLDGLTLATVKELPKQTTKTIMKDFIGYKRDENDKSESDKDKTASSPETVKTKQIHLDLAAYYYNVKYFKVPEEQQQYLMDFLDNEDEEEITDLLETVGRCETYNDGILTIGGEEPDLTYEFAKPENIYYLEGENEDEVVNDFGEHCYKFITINPDKTVTMNIPKNCPEWLVESYIKPLCKFAEKSIAEHNFSDSETIDIDDLTDEILNDSEGESWGDLTMPNYDENIMMIGIAEQLKGIFECEIEIPENEKFDASKVKALFFSSLAEPQFLGELEAIPLYGLIYGDTYYDLDFVSGDSKGRDMWVTSPGDWQPFWPLVEDEDW